MWLFVIGMGFESLRHMYLSTSIQLSFSTEAISNLTQGIGTAFRLTCTAGMTGQG